MTNWKNPCAALAVVVLLLLSGGAARADGVAAPLPRVALGLDDTSVVVIAAHKKLYAFLDGADDNAPVRGAAVQISTPRATLALQEISPGIYVSGSYQPPAVRTPLTVSVTVAGKTVRGTADLVLADLPDSAAGGSSRLGLRLLILALVVGGIVGIIRYMRSGTGWWWPGRTA